MTPFVQAPASDRVPHPNSAEAFYRECIAAEIPVTRWSAYMIKWAIPTRERAIRNAWDDMDRGET